ncbi:hypothetical protein RCZ04_20500 [Capnocytophaga sp. HP1101]
MQLKKNPKADLAKRSGLFFAIGFAAISGFTLWGFEAKIQDKGNLSYNFNDNIIVCDEPPTIIELPTPEVPQQAPPPPQLTQEINVVDNTIDVIEPEIASTETNPSSPVAPETITIVPEDDEKPEIVVPFAVIEDKPMFKECKGVAREKQSQCFKEQLDKHVIKNFIYPEDAANMGIEGKVFVNFRINTDGSITVLGVRGGNKLLENEAQRIIEKLPRLIPGKQREVPTPVTFAYPINFKLNNK